MIDDRLLSIGITEARQKCKGITSLEERTKAAMNGMKHHWFVTDEGQQLKCAVIAAMMESHDDVEKEKLAASHRNLAKLSSYMAASLNGVEVGSLNIDDNGDLPLMMWWRE